MQLDVELDVSQLVLDESIPISAALDIEVEFSSPLDIEFLYGTKLRELDDVSLPDLVDKEIIQYDEASDKFIGTTTPTLDDVFIEDLHSEDSGGGVSDEAWDWLDAVDDSLKWVVITIIEKLFSLYSSLTNLFTITKDPTGFVSPELVTVTYDSTTRKITLTGTTTAYYRGVLVEALVSGWQSSAHDNNSNSSFFLYYNGTSFLWSENLFPGFSVLLIAAIKYRTDAKFGMRECHGLMPWQCHQSDHYNIGTYRESGGDISGVNLLSTTAADRRPDISQCTLWDEDNPTISPALISKLYTQRFLGTAGAIQYTFNAADIVALSGNNPYYNSFSSPNYGQTLMPANSLMTVWLYAVPVTADAESQRIRFVMVQGQSVTVAQNSSPSALTTAYNLEAAKNPSELNLGDSALVAAEYVCIHKFIIQYTANNWTIRASTRITGSRAIQVNSPSGNYLSEVAVDGGLTGTGTTANPLRVLASSGNAFTAAIDLSIFDKHYSSYSLTGALELSVAAGAVVGGCAEGVIVGDGTNTPTLSGITLWPGSDAYDPTSLKQNLYMIAKFESGVYIQWKQLN